MRKVLWHVLMLIWLAGLVLGVFYIWPFVQPMQLTGDAVAAVLWLIMGALAWLMAFNFGRQRYWRR
jgi:multidrug resistance efflux pump